MTDEMPRWKVDRRTRVSRLLCVFPQRFDYAIASVRQNGSEEAAGSKSAASSRVYGENRLRGVGR